MEEYIEKNQLKEKLRSLFKYESFPIADIEQIIDWLPVIPKHGHWIYEGEIVTCSNCGGFWTTKDLTKFPHYYCPHCGAKMDESEA